MSRIETTFKKLRETGGRALIPFITAGDPEPGVTVPLMHALVAAGANVIELGIPFSDPMSDGPVIQRASERALASGMTLSRVLEMVAEFRKKDSDTPLVLMGYMNPFEAMGYREFASRAREAGVDGVLAVDCPPEEGGDWILALRAACLDPIFLLSPTTEESRVEKIAGIASGYLYYVSLKGVTGAAHLDLEAAAEKIGEIRKKVSLPIAIGFGIRDPEAARAAAGISDGVIVGSRIVQEIENSEGGTAITNVSRLVATMRQAIDREDA